MLLDYQPSYAIQITFIEIFSPRRFGSKRDGPYRCPLKRKFNHRKKQLKRKQQCRGKEEKRKKTMKDLEMFERIKNNFESAFIISGLEIRCEMMGREAS
jgi:hypothetical protein